jgi:hypothetical protein
MKIAFHKIGKIEASVNIRIYCRILQNVWCGCYNEAVTSHQTFNRLVITYCFMLQIYHTRCVDTRLLSYARGDNGNCGT